MNMEPCSVQHIYNGTDNLFTHISLVIYHSITVDSSRGTSIDTVNTNKSGQMVVQTQMKREINSIRVMWVSGKIPKQHSQMGPSWAQPGPNWGPYGMLLGNKH